MSDQNLPVFVYGTLMQGFGNSCVLGAPDRVRPAKVKVGDMFHRTYGQYPCVIPTEDGGEVQGELADLSEEYYDYTLEDLDYLEGYHPEEEYSLYDRRVVRVEVDGESVDAWMYVMKEVPDDAVPVPSGNWKAFMEGRK